ncbi:MAG TPA: response regulator [Gemmatimonadaceae bacterium]|nr:response regulator [Gemmatimonadaceae bacterium]
MSAPSDSVRHIRVLLADDEASTREALTRLLEQLGHTVVAAEATGADAVRRAVELSPDVVLLDVHMPDGSGIDAAKAISRERPATAVILFSGDRALELSDADVQETSAIAFLEKPTPARVLDTQIRMAVERAHAIEKARSDAANARDELAQRKLIERAKGVLMRRSGASEQEAYHILQRTSQDRSVAMVEIAKAVLASEQTAGPASQASTLR